LYTHMNNKRKKNKIHDNRLQCERGICNYTVRFLYCKVVQYLKKHQ
jgi:hypothetical protein